MVEKISVEQLIKDKDAYVVDVRTECEYNDGCIPGARNMPIFNEVEREEIGICYKNKSINEAKRIGLKYGSEKLVTYFDIALKNSREHKNTVFYCWRGGLRSGVIASTLSSLGLRVLQLEGGYKSFRKFVINSLGQYQGRFKYIVLHGNTGVGKTAMLNKLDEMGYPVLNLEKLANNKGSFFGGIGCGKPIGQKMFESLLLQKLSTLSSDYIIVESESKRIGKVILPDFIVEGIRSGHHILIKTDLTNRIERLVNEYSLCSSKDEADELLINCLDRMRKNLGNAQVDYLISEVVNSNYHLVATKLLTDYYDPLYSHSESKYGVFDKVIEYKNLDEAILELRNTLEYKLNSE